jgi:4-amino-4-deoxy-L-arabinose transferase-like glycosyltransferase
MLRKLALVVAAQHVRDRARRLVELEVELAKAELREKTQLYGAGIGLGIGAAVVTLFAVGFLFAAGAAGLALVMPWWAALLVVFGLLLGVAAALAAAAVQAIKSAGPPVPDQAIEEVRLTRARIRSNGS